MVLLTDRSQGGDSGVVLSRQMLLVTHGAHAVSARVAVKSTAVGAEHGHGALIGLLGHSGGYRLSADKESPTEDK